MRWLEYLVFVALVVGLARPVGLYLFAVFERRPTLLDPVLKPVESLLLWSFGIRRDQEIVLFSAVGAGLLLALLTLQTWLAGTPADPIWPRR